MSYKRTNSYWHYLGIALWEQVKSLGLIILGVIIFLLIMFLLVFPLVLTERSNLWALVYLGYWLIGVAIKTWIDMPPAYESIQNSRCKR